MATIDLGKIKLVNRGAYDNATAYTVDDLVQSGGTTYICIQNSTGNAVSNNSYWSVLAQGGTDIGTTLTTQGDILYRDGSGLQRLAAGTNGQALLTGGTGANPSWGTLSSDYVKLGSGNVTSGGSFNIDGYFTNTYDVFKLFTWGRTAWHKIRFRFSDGTYSNSNYVWICDYGQRSSSSNANSASGSWNDSYGILSYWSGDNADEYHHAETTFIRPWDSSGYAKNCSVQGWDYNSSEVHTYNNAIYLDANRYNEAMTGVHIFPTSGTLSDTSWLLYGIKA
mgnify:FL=1|tara:strand:- start:247 stop:1086 length:840 start_codon:yes stop_codon:yes gene_type:complete